MKQVSISAATLDDADGIRNIHRHCDDPWRDAHECRAWVGKRLESGFYIQIARLGGKIVGHGEWLVDDSESGRVLYLGLLQLDEDYQRMGIGSRMVEDGIRYAREYKCREIVTIPDTDNTSIVFYEKCGFRKRRSIMQCHMDTRCCPDSLNITRHLDMVPITAAENMPFTFGLAQASSRHMWEVCNNKPRTDDRKTPAAKLHDGSVIQLSFFDGDSDALALLWSKNPTGESIKAILDFGYRNGLRHICFRFFEEYAYLFGGSKSEVCDTEIYLPV